MNPFEGTLQTVVERVPGALGAIFADWEGEPVAQFSFELAPLDIQIVGAQWGLAWTAIHGALGRAALGGARELCALGERGGVVVRRVDEGYYVVLALRHGTHLATAMRELDAIVDALRAEM